MSNSKKYEQLPCQGLHHTSNLRVVLFQLNKNSLVCFGGLGLSVADPPPGLVVYFTPRILSSLFQAVSSVYTFPCSSTAADQS